MWKEEIYLTRVLLPLTARAHSASCHNRSRSQEANARLRFSLPQDFTKRTPTGATPSYAHLEPRLNQATEGWSSTSEALADPWLCPVALTALDSDDLV